MSNNNKIELIEPIATALGLLKAFELSGNYGCIEEARQQLHIAALAIMDTENNEPRSATVTAAGEQAPSSGAVPSLTEAA